MSATDELCRLLEERNEEYDRRDNTGGLPSYVLVGWYFNIADRAYFYGYPDGHTKLITYRCTYDLDPAQAIAATLGDADATGARQGDAGTCHDMGGCRWFRCSACGFGIEDMYVNDEDEYPPEEQPKHCPNCGRLVVEVDG